MLVCCDKRDDDGKNDDAGNTTDQPCAAVAVWVN